MAISTETSPRRALITGITGQGGSYLAELLLSKGYEVYGLVRRVALEDPENRLSRLSGIRSRIKLQAASLESYASRVHHHPDQRSGHPLSALGLAVDRSALPVLFRRSIEMFGKAETVPQDELTRFHPRSTYGISKVAGYDTQYYREAHGVHESPWRGFEFVTRKIRAGVARILAGRSNEPRLGNLDAKGDWGHAREYVEAMWLMLQQPSPTTTWLPPEKPIPSGSLWNWHSTAPGWTGRPTSIPIRICTGRRRSISSRKTPARPAEYWGGVTG